MLWVGVMVGAPGGVGAEALAFQLACGSLPVLGPHNVGGSYTLGYIIPKHHGDD